MKHFSFPEIRQFRQVIRSITDTTRFAGLDANGDPTFDGLRPLPTIKYKGTVKLHGANSAIGKSLEDGEYSTQSRNQILTVDNDNYGFAKFVSGIDLNNLFSLVDINAVDVSTIDPEDEECKNAVIIYGEWCGGSIQDNVALCQLEKMFVVFAIKCRGVWMNEENVKKVKMPENRVFNIFDYPSFTMDIDFQHPEVSQNKLGEITVGVEQECPVGKAFGVVGVGEGVVWTPVDPQWNNAKFWFKVKGEKHSASKVKKLASVDIEKVNSINELMDKVVTENRLRQGVTVVTSLKGVPELDRTHISDFIRWVNADVIKEELDLIVASGLEPKDVGGHIAKKAKEWLFNVLKI